MLDHYPYWNQFKSGIDKLKCKKHKSTLKTAYNNENITSK